MRFAAAMLPCAHFIDIAELSGRESLYLRSNEWPGGVAGSGA
jgi:hypothetical protein